MARWARTWPSARSAWTARFASVTEFDTDDESQLVTEVGWPVFQTTPSSPPGTPPPGTPPP
jgi:hypothetical protein